LFFFLLPPDSALDHTKLLLSSVIIFKRYHLRWTRKRTLHKVSLTFIAKGMRRKHSQDTQLYSQHHQWHKQRTIHVQLMTLYLCGVWISKHKFFSNLH
jgi:hypothetical protein